MSTHTRTKKRLRVEPNSLDEFYTVRAFVEKYENKFNDHKLRYLLRNRDQNGLDDCVVERNGRLFVHDPSFLVWFASDGKH